MTGKNLATVGTVIVVVAVATGLVTYRMGVKRGRSGPASRIAAPSAQTNPAGSNCIDFHDAAAHTGETACVTGRVLRVYTSRAGNTFLDFCSDYRSCPFTSVIFSSDAKKFGNLQSLSGRQVEIHGEITSYQNKPEIIIRSPEQIRAAD